MAAAKIGNEEFGSQEVLKSDRAVRDHLGLPHRGGEMRQPWYEKKAGRWKQEPAAVVEVCYTIIIEKLCDTELAAEEISHIRRVKVNGREISLCPAGVWIDPCFTRLKIPMGYMKTGSNSLVLEMDYYADSGIEAVYLLGDFGVRLEGGKRPVITLPDKIMPGDISKQGFPFYSGKITYKFPKILGSSEVRMRAFKGACVKLLGKEEKILGFEPYVDRAEDLYGIQIVLGRRNTFGPLHQYPREQPFVEPASFLTMDDKWSEEYVLYEQGMLEIPAVTVQ